MKYSIYFALTLTVLCLASNASSIDNGGRLQKTTSARRVTGTSPQKPTVADAKPTSVREQEVQKDVQKEPCTKTLNLSGTFNGVVFLDKNDKGGAPASITVEGNTFRVTSEKLEATGIISGLNTCGEASIALKFTQGSVKNLVGESVSLDARVVGGSENWTSLDRVTTDKPVVLSTAKDKVGNFAGPDVAFVVCPDPPACKRYPTCPCPEPPNKP